MTSTMLKTQCERRPRIGILYLGSRGGICYYTHELVRVLADHADVSVYLSSRNSTLASYQALPVTLRVFDTYSGMSSLLASLVSRKGPGLVATAVDADRPELLLDTGSGPWAEIVKSRLKTRPILTDVIHDVKAHPDRWRWLLNLQHVVYPKRSDAYVALSNFSYKELVQRFPGARHIESVHGIINRPEHVPDPTQVSAKRDRLLFFGRIEAYKGLDVLVEAFAAAKAKRPQLALTIAGEGPVSPTLKAQMAALEIRLINTWLSDEMIAELLTGHGQMILPYRSATQSGVVATALAYGLPCIGTTVGGLQEQIVHGETGLLVPPEAPLALAEAMVRLAEDGTLAEAMSRAAAELAGTKYDWEQIGLTLKRDLDALL
jgi:glycosyltransferase involved in cell wall biosynthesis